MPELVQLQAEALKEKSSPGNIGSHLTATQKVSVTQKRRGAQVKLKLQYFGHLIWRANSLEKPLKLGKIEGKRKRGWQWIKWVR